MKISGRSTFLILLFLTLSQACTATEADLEPTTVNLKVAFIGDQGIAPDEPQAVQVLELIRNEGTHLVIHSGDFDYNDDPLGWDAQIDGTLGSAFPYLASVGNHDQSEWSGPQGYQTLLQARVDRIEDLTCIGDYGNQSACEFRGLLVLLSGVGTLSGPETYTDSSNPPAGSQSAFLADALAESDRLWRICSWHKNQYTLQLGSKRNQVGYSPYEVCRLGGAIITTGHEHSYSRTKTLVDITHQTVDPAWLDPNHLRVAPGATFLFVSGLAGWEIRDQNRCLPFTYPYGCNEEWAMIYTSDQNAQYGALFCSFHVEGRPELAQCYFKNIDGQTVDQFDVVRQTSSSENGQTPSV